MNAKRDRVKLFTGSRLTRALIGAAFVAAVSMTLAYLAGGVAAVAKFEWFTAGLAIVGFGVEMTSTYAKDRESEPKS